MRMQLASQGMSLRSDVSISLDNLSADIASASSALHAQATIAVRVDCFSRFIFSYGFTAKTRTLAAY